MTQKLEWTMPNGITALVFNNSSVLFFLQNDEASLKAKIKEKINNSTKYADYFTINSSNDNQLEVKFEHDISKSIDVTFYVKSNILPDKNIWYKVENVRSILNKDTINMYTLFTQCKISNGKFDNKFQIIINKANNRECFFVNEEMDCYEDFSDVKLCSCYSSVLKKTRKWEIGERYLTTVYNTGLVYLGPIHSSLSSNCSQLLYNNTGLDNRPLHVGITYEDFKKLNTSDMKEVLSNCSYNLVEFDTIPLGAKISKNPLIVDNDSNSSIYNKLLEAIKYTYYSDDLSSTVVCELVRRLFYNNNSNINLGKRNTKILECILRKFLIKSAVSNKFNINSINKELLVAFLQTGNRSISESTINDMLKYLKIDIDLVVNSAINKLIVTKNNIIRRGKLTDYINNIRLMQMSEYFSPTLKVLMNKSDFNNSKDPQNSHKIIQSEVTRMSKTDEVNEIVNLIHILINYTIFDKKSKLTDKLEYFSGVRRSADAFSMYVNVSNIPSIIQYIKSELNEKINVDQLTREIIENKFLELNVIVANK